MKAVTFTIMFASTLVLAGVAPSIAYNAADCPDRTSGNNWCSAQLEKDGWMLKYKAHSSPQLMDVYWVYEVWIRERSAMVCAHVGGRAGVRINGCQTLDEVDR